jgi:hypothetical protein
VTAPLEHGRSAGRSDRARRPLKWVSRTAARRVLIALHAAALAVAAIELIVPFGGHSADGHAGHGVERVGALDFVASYALYGFFGCVALVLIGKLLRSAVMRDEHYYKERD